MPEIKAGFWDVRIGWDDNRGYCDTSRHISTDNCGSALDALKLCQEWSTGCPENSSLWKNCSVTLYNADGTRR
jgi:hypothetical protein